MERKKKILKILGFCAFWGIILIGCNLAIYLGVEEKSIWDRAWDLFSGGAIGVLAGLGFFLAYGAIGFVSGPLIHGSLHLMALMTAGGLSGLGLGSISYVMRNPDKYNFSWSIIILILIFTFYAARKVSKKFIVNSEAKLQIPFNAKN